ncbi:MULTISPECIES: hypothetical protein [Fischerella]|uniref:hypothetical protein n=1 Tax=Fischerella TaxID=1190 RepID=UPI0012FA3D5C|nr:MULTISPECIES: hypothetical protein [Fischerella]MBD2430014.1 hypothetical protein [Fischerella sp. FACHB-380]
MPGNPSTALAPPCRSWGPVSSPSPHHPISPSPHLPITPSPHLPIPPQPHKVGTPSPPPPFF